MYKDNRIKAYQIGMLLQLILRQNLSHLNQPMIMWRVYGKGRDLWLVMTEQDKIKIKDKVYLEYMVPFYFDWSS